MIYDARKAFESLEVLRKHAQDAINAAVQNLPYSECRYCGGQGRHPRDIAEAVLKMPFGDDCEHCLGTGVECWCPFDMPHATWLRLVLMSVRREIELTDDEETAIATVEALFTMEPAPADSSSSDGGAS